MIGSTVAKLCKLLAPGALAVAGALSAVSMTAGEASAEQWVDLTHPFNAESVYWPTAKMFEKETVFAGHTEGGWYYSAFNFAAAEHGGTHIDAPIHFAEGALTLDRLPVSQLIGPGVVIDVREQAAKEKEARVFAFDATETGTRATYTSVYDTAEGLQQVLEMGVEEGATSAINQIDDLLAA